MMSLIIINAAHSKNYIKFSSIMVLKLFVVVGFDDDDTTPMTSTPLPNNPVGLKLETTISNFKNGLRTISSSMRIVFYDIRYRPCG